MPIAIWFSTTVNNAPVTKAGATRLFLYACTSNSIEAFDAAIPAEVSNVTKSADCTPAKLQLAPAEQFES